MDNQITGKDESKNFYKLYTIKNRKRIFVYDELVNAPAYDHIKLDNVKWIDIKGINTPFYKIQEWGEL